MLIDKNDGRLRRLRSINLFSSLGLFLLVLLLFSVLYSPFFHNLVFPLFVLIPGSMLVNFSPWQPVRMGQFFEYCNMPFTPEEAAIQERQDLYGGIHLFMMFMNIGLLYRFHVLFFACSLFMLYLPATFVIEAGTFVLI